MDYLRAVMAADERSPRALALTEEVRERRIRCACRITSLTRMETVRGRVGADAELFTLHGLVLPPSRAGDGGRGLAAGV